MKLLLDSHTLIWAVDDPSQLSPQAVSAIRDASNERFLSAATLWEIAVKNGLGKLTLSLPYGQWMAKALADLVLNILPITVEFADAQVQLPFHHRDPFDRMLIAQSQVAGLVIVSRDSLLDQYGIQRLW